MLQLWQSSRLLVGPPILLIHRKVWTLETPARFVSMFPLPLLCRFVPMLNLPHRLPSTWLRLVYSGRRRLKHFTMPRRRLTGSRLPFTVASPRLSGRLLGSPSRE